MKLVNINILTINGGSSSIKFDLYSIDEKPKMLIASPLKRIGLENPEFTVTNHITNEKKEIILDAKVISPGNSQIKVYVIPTYEEILIAKSTRELYIKTKAKINI